MMGFRCVCVDEVCVWWVSGVCVLMSVDEVCVWWVSCVCVLMSVYEVCV